VHLTPALQQVAASAVLHDELDARWPIVETSFDANIGSALMCGGVTLSGVGETLQAPIIRRASARDALVGFEHGRCFTAANR
jgi:hypothetical protein